MTLFVLQFQIIQPQTPERSDIADEKISDGLITSDTTNRVQRVVSGAKKMLQSFTAQVVAHTEEDLGDDSPYVQRHMARLKKLS